MPEVDLVLGNAEKLTADAYRNVPDFGLAGEEKIRVNDIMSRARDGARIMVEGFGGPRRAPSCRCRTAATTAAPSASSPTAAGTRAPSPMGAVVEQVRRLVDNGFGEVVLTGVDITVLGRRPARRAAARRARAGSILKHVPELAAARLSSIDSIEADADLMRAIAEEERLMPHLHLSLQAGDDLILKRMKRRHRRADAIRFCDDVRQAPAGHRLRRRSHRRLPDRDRGDVRESRRSIVEECGLTYLHVFPFSPRPGTPAARMPQLPRQLVRERAARLREAGEAALARLSCRARSVRRRSVLVERPGLRPHRAFAPVCDSTPGARRRDRVGDECHRRSQRELVGCRHEPA